MSLGTFIQWICVVWILITVGSVVASAPLAWRVLVEGEKAELKVLAWGSIMWLLCLPAAIVLAYLRSDARKDEVAKWIHEENRCLS